MAMTTTENTDPVSKDPKQQPKEGETQRTVELTEEEKKSQENK